ncbi:MAG: hypothetical protein HQL22_04940 [Candidatus Omnitrophica bacterium]|nr:hypothetical protein [Candidatus Omnitrophota bacterium]
MFRNFSKRQGLKLVTVELAFDGEPFTFSKQDSDILVQLRTSSENVLWQKEAMFNVALRHLPHDCDKVAWLDCDIVFKNDHWIWEVSELLEEYVVVQPFAFAICLTHGDMDGFDQKFVLNEFVNNESFYGIACGAQNHTGGSLGRRLSQGHVGFAWAARREFLDNHGFFDCMILGVGDALMAYAFYNYRDSFSERNFITPAARKRFIGWLEQVYPDVEGSVGYLDGKIFHLWHGDYSKRQYAERHFIELLHDFDPVVDIVKDFQGIWKWSSNKPDFHRAVRNYIAQSGHENTTVSFLHKILSGIKFKPLQRFLRRKISSLWYWYSYGVYVFQKNVVMRNFLK